MYIPAQFRETERKHQLDLIRNHSFGVLVSNHAGQPFASHLPFMLDTDPDGEARLFGHMARANPQWQSFDAGATVLAIFQGPHAYVSPSWYSTPGVPTWNYATVHVYGTARVIHDTNIVRRHLELLVDEHEAQSVQPWTIAATGGQFDPLLSAVVAFEICISDIQGKFKLSQNRPAQDRVSVAQHLRARAGTLDSTLADLMECRQER